MWEGREERKEEDGARKGEERRRERTIGRFCVASNAFKEIT